MADSMDSGLTTDIFDNLNAAWDGFVKGGDPKSHPVNGGMLEEITHTVGIGWLMSQRQHKNQALAMDLLRNTSSFKASTTPRTNTGTPGSGFVVDVKLDPSRINVIPPEGGTLHVMAKVQAGPVTGIPVSAATRKKAKMQKRYANSKSASQGY